LKFKLHIGLSLLLFFYSSVYTSQIISQFTWDSNPVTTAVIGPNATSIGSNATSSPGGVGGTNGLNPGIPTIDVNMNIPNTGNIFDINSIDVSIDYKRNESTAQMIKRGAFTFNTGGGSANFSVTYRVNNGGTPVTITSTIVNIPQDNTFRNYRFTYDNCSGIGKTYVNNVVVWTSPTPTANLNLYWVGDGNMIIGQDMDGAGNNIPNLDNFILQPFTCVSLPIELVYFTGIKYENKNLLKWGTATENNNDYFTIEQSEDGLTWNEIQKIYGAANSRSTKFYSTYVNEPNKILNYYRLKQTDFDGQTKKFTTIAIDNSHTNNVKIIKTVDLLGREVNTTYEGVKLIYYSDGSVIKCLSE